MTVYGTRPEIIRLCFVMKSLDQYCEHITVHTGQNFHSNLSDVFFDELRLRSPDHNLDVRGRNFGEQAGDLFSKFESVLDEVKPDRILILGDTNSALSALVAARRGIPVFHMEAGNRCYDDRVPEEVNRRIIDHSSTFLLPYTERSKDNLVREGIERERIFVTGNPIFEVLSKFRTEIDASPALAELGVSANEYFLATIHRAENVDDSESLKEIFGAFEAIASKYQKPILVSVHPRTAEKLDRFGLAVGSENIRLLEAMPFFSFVKLEKNAFMVLSDSGTVQEECSIFQVPNVTVRNVTERPETIECGSNIMGGTKRESIVSAVDLAAKSEPNWNPPPEYLVEDVARTVTNIVLGHNSLRKHH